MKIYQDLPGSSKILAKGSETVPGIEYPRRRLLLRKLVRGLLGEERQDARKYTTKEMAAEEVPEEVQKANDGRQREHFKMENIEIELQGRLLDHPGPRLAVTEQIFHPVLPVK